LIDRPSAKSSVSFAGFAAVLLGNAIPEVLFGWLFSKKGVEAAMLAHMLAHLISTALT
jgi:hypothetical protein